MIRNKLKEFNFDKFDGGINNQFLKSKIRNNELSKCVNMHYSDGQLKTRDGIKIVNEISFIDDEKGYKVKPIGSYIYTDSMAVRLFVLTQEIDGIYYNDFLVLKSDGSYNRFSLRSFFESDYENGIDRINYLSFSGKSVFASGIYITIGVVDTTDTVCDRYIFELNTNLSATYPVSVSEIYAPLVYVNGRGTSYGDLLVSYRTFPSPRALEDFNMFSSGFRAAYTTDGLSDTFYLPAKNLSNETGENVKVVYTDGDGKNHTWVIPFNDSISRAVTIGEKTCCVTINRAKGCLYFNTVEGGAFALPMSNGIYNNLVVTAFKSPDNDRLFKMTVAESFNSRVFLSGYGKEGNLVCFSKQNNPLYFPTSNLSYFGDKTSCVIAMKQQNDRLVLFKAHQIGICSSISYSEYNVDSILNGHTSKASTKEKMEVKTINTGIGCIYPDTILNCANRLVFWGSDKRVYTITSTSNYLQRFYRVSDKIDSLLGSISVNENAFSLNFDGKYMLFIDDNCYSFDYNTTSFFSATSSGNKSKSAVSWFYYLYDFGISKPFFAMSVDKSVVLFSKVDDEQETRKIIGHTFSGTKDEKLTSIDEYQTSPIKSSFTTCASNFDKDAYKKIVGVEIVLTGDKTSPDTDVEVYYHNENRKKFISQEKPSLNENRELKIKKSPALSGIRHFGVSLESEKSFSVKQIKIIYKTAD